MSRTTMPEPNPVMIDLWLKWLDNAETLLRHPAMELAPKRLWQSILPGWIFAQNVNVNSLNSSSPETEQAVLAQHSYGRQLGKLLDAVDVLIKERHHKLDAEDEDALSDLQDLHAEIDGIKDAAKMERFESVYRDLAALKRTDSESFHRLVGKLVALVDERS